MKATTCFLVMCIFMLTVPLKADLDVFDVCTAGGDQKEPDIDGDWVVWQDERNGASNRDIYGYTLAEPNEIEICTASSDQHYATVSGGTVVWQDERDGQRDIYAFDLLNRQPLDLPNMPRNDDVYQQYPDISGDTIVYRNRPGGTYNLFAYDIPVAASAQITTTSTIPSNHVVDGNIVAWMEGNRVYYQDISAAAAERVNESAYGQWYPAVSGSLIVWAEDRGTGTGLDLYGFDANTPGDGDFPVFVEAGEQNRPAICGNIVVWQDRPDGRSDYDIRGLDLTGGSPFPIDTTIKNDQYPAICGRTVVWQRNNTDWDIVGSIIPSTTEIDVLSPDGDEQVLAGSAMTIAWQLTDGNPPALVDVEYSTNNGAGWVTIETDIPFGDTYAWQPVADVNSVACRIRVSAAGDPSVSDVSEPFTIFRCSADLTADVTGDCFVGLEDFAELTAQWLACGNPYDENWCFN